MRWYDNNTVYTVDVVPGATAAFTNHTLWPELRNKAPLGQGIVQHHPSPYGEGGCVHEYHCKAHHIGRGCDQIGHN